jgi:hypothetical protein
MIIKRVSVVLIIIVLSALNCNADDLTIDKLYGTWQITREDGSNPLKWEEFYKFNKNGTLDYMGNNNSRNYKFDLKNNQLIIHREFGPLTRTVKEYEGDKIVLFDNTLEIIFILTKKN